MALTITERVPVGLDMQPCALSRADSILLPTLTRHPNSKDQQSRVNGFPCT